MQSNAVVAKDETSTRKLIYASIFECTTVVLMMNNYDAIVSAQILIHTSHICYYFICCAHASESYAFRFLMHLPRLPPHVAPFTWCMLYWFSDFLRLAYCLNEQQSCPASVLRQSYDENIFSPSRLLNDYYSSWASASDSCITLNLIQEATIRGLRWNYYCMLVPVSAFNYSNQSALLPCKKESRGSKLVTSWAVCRPQDKVFNNK